MPERVQRYSEAERAGQAANRRAATAGAKYGHSYANQGYRPVTDQGKHFLYEQGLKQKYGAFANSTWQYEDRGGQLYRKPFANQSGRIAEQGGTAQWEPVPDYVQRAYQNPQRRAWNAAHPDAAARPGGGRDQFLFDRYTSGLQTDPATGLKVNAQGELYDPRMFGQAGYTGGAIGQAGQMPGGFGRPQPGPAGPYGGINPGGMYSGGFGGYGQMGGYIPGYAMPFGMQNYGMPQYGGQNLGQMAGNSPTYRTFQQGATAGTYNPFQAYQPGYASGNF